MNTQLLGKQPHQNGGVSLGNLGKYNKSIQAYDKAIQVDTNSGYSCRLVILDGGT
jgi:hypothetical protein